MAVYEHVIEHIMYYAVTTVQWWLVKGNVANYVIMLQAFYFR